MSKKPTFLPGHQLLSSLDEQLSRSELNTFLLELFRRKTAALKPAQVLRQFTTNRFTRLTDLDPIALKQMEISWLQTAREQSFRPIQLSPLSPLGCCSVMGKVDQNKVVSALRGTEILSDATNILALQIAAEVKQQRDRQAIHRLATTHRHVRAQAFDNPSYNAHFSLFCLASGGFDRGNLETEWLLFSEHLELCYQLLRRYFSEEELEVKLYVKNSQQQFIERVGTAMKKEWKYKGINIAETAGTDYYDLIQFKIWLHRGGRAMDLADGGLVDWTQRLLSNKKHRLCISGIGLERVLLSETS